MAMFKVKASDPSGVVIERVVEASSKASVKEELAREGLFAVEINSTGKELRGLSFSVGSKGASVAGSDFIVFNQGFMSLLRAGLGVLKSLEGIIDKNKNDAFSKTIRKVIDDVKSGKSLADAFESEGGVFTPLYIATIRSGEKTGDLVPALKSYIDYQKKFEALKKKIKSAVTYPIAVIMFSGLIVAGLLFFVVPTFSDIYISAGVELPLISRILLQLSSFLTDYFLFCIIFAFVLFFTAKWYAGTDNGRGAIDKALVTMPKAGIIYHEYATTKFSKTLAMVLKSGMNLIESLEMAKGVLSNTYLEAKMTEVIDNAKQGASITSALEETGVLPDMSIKMFDVGEKSASLEIVLEDIALYNEEQVDYKLGILTDVFEPVLMVLLGLIIGFIVLAIYLPMFMLGRVF